MPKSSNPAAGADPRDDIAIVPAEHDERDATIAERDKISLGKARDQLVEGDADARG